MKTTLRAGSGAAALLLTTDVVQASRSFAGLQGLFAQVSALILFPVTIAASFLSGAEELIQIWKIMVSMILISGSVDCRASMLLRRTQALQGVSCYIMEMATMTATPGQGAELLVSSLVSLPSCSP